MELKAKAHVLFQACEREVELGTTLLNTGSCCFHWLIVQVNIRVDLRWKKIHQKGHLVEDFGGCDHVLPVLVIDLVVVALIPNDVHFYQEEVGLYSH